MAFVKNDALRYISVPTQKYIVVEENVFGFDGSIKVIATNTDEVTAIGEMVVFLPHTPGLHEKSPGGLAKNCKDCMLELDV
jgi:Na+-translocating ferredoxin:NAD+ oxidoreductase RnfG subunit